MKNNIKFVFFYKELFYKCKWYNCLYGIIDELDYNKLVYSYFNEDELIYMSLDEFKKLTNINYSNMICGESYLNVKYESNNQINYEILNNYKELKCGSILFLEKDIMSQLIFDRETKKIADENLLILYNTDLKDWIDAKLYCDIF